jgi:Domain of unknown function (DUF3471)
VPVRNAHPTIAPLVAICAAMIAVGSPPPRAVAEGVSLVDRLAAVGNPPLDSYVGFYRADPNALPDMVVAITREGDHFFEQPTGHARFEIFPQNDHEFFPGIRPDDSRIAFVRDAQGQAIGMVLHENGWVVSATRTDEAEAKRASDLYQQRLVDQARPRTAVKIDPTAFDRYVGYYALNSRSVFHITRDGDRFFSQRTGPLKFEIFPESETDYFAPDVHAQITFTVDGQGQVAGLVLHQNGRELPARRVDEAQAQQADASFEELKKQHAEDTRPHVAIKVDPQSQDRYVGFYEVAPEFIFAVTRTGDQLFAQVGGQKLPIFPEQEREYFYAAIAAQIKFVADSQGRVTELVQRQNGFDIRAMRIGDVPVADRPPAAVDPTTLDRYVGWYEPPLPRYVVTVTREGDHLFVHETGQAKTELIPRSAAGYTAADGIGPDVMFEGASQGGPSGLVMYDAARGAVRAPRIDAARAHQLDTVAARQLADAPERFKKQIPAPGSEAALRHHFEAFARGAPDYGQMAARIAPVISQQTHYLMTSLTALGAIESAVFKGVGPGGFDIYAVKFAHGEAQIRLSLTDDGKLQGLNFRPDGDGSPGAVVACSEEDKLKSSTAGVGGLSVRMTLVNRSGSEIRVSPVVDGKRTPFTTILDEGSSVLTWPLTVPLVVTDLSDRCLQIIRPGTTTRHIAITSASPDGSSGGATAARNTPAPGGEAALRQLIDGIRHGEPDYTRMSVQAANTMRQQQLYLHQEIWSRMGAIQAITFVGIGSAGEDIYQVRCENGSAEVRLDLLKDGRIGSLALGPE